MLQVGMYSLYARTRQLGADNIFPEMDSETGMRKGRL